MSDVVLYHHVQGLTEGVRSFAEELRQAGHTVHTPDLFDGRTFDTLEEQPPPGGGCVCCSRPAATEAVWAQAY